MLRACPNTLIGKRDAAMIAVGFAGALRRSEICTLAVDDVEFLDSVEDDRDRMWITIRQSKTDQHGKGQRVAILDGRAVRPITHLRVWLESSGITGGPVFQTMKRGGYLRAGRCTIATFLASSSTTLQASDWTRRTLQGIR